jgi:hypothetical protein
LNFAATRGKGFRFRVSGVSVQRGFRPKGPSPQAKKFLIILWILSK